MMSISNIRRLLAVGLLTISALIGSAIALPASAEAHDTPPWKCQYLAADQPNGERYTWMVNNCIPWRTKHTYYHAHGWMWPCKIMDLGPRRNECVIRKLFGKVGGTALANKAVAVARCESTLRRSATNGQYRGLFQLGSHERATYGYGSSAIEQTQGAIRLYRARGWQPWSCA